jgi:hypothetical protein
MSLMYRRKKVVESVLPCGMPWVMVCVWFMLRAACAWFAAGLRNTRR